MNIQYYRIVFRCCLLMPPSCQFKHVPLPSRQCERDFIFFIIVVEKLACPRVEIFRIFMFHASTNDWFQFQFSFYYFGASLKLNNFTSSSQFSFDFLFFMIYSLTRRTSHRRTFTSTSRRLFVQTPDHQRDRLTPHISHLFIVQFHFNVIIPSVNKFSLHSIHNNK